MNDIIVVECEEKASNALANLSPARAATLLGARLALGSLSPGRAFPSRRRLPLDRATSCPRNRPRIRPHAIPSGILPATDVSHIAARALSFLLVVKIENLNLDKD
jgi:hypothetical protein